MTTANKLENLREMELTINKIENMITKSRQEMKSLEVEWLHLRGLVTENSDDKTKQTETPKPEPVKIEVNFDDVNQINSAQFHPDSLRSSNTIYLKSNFSENESSDED